MGKKWDERKSEREGNYQKMMRKSQGRKISDLREQFELDEQQWKKKKGKGWFAARVVEVHKRYAFVSVEHELGEVDTRDVWLATVARKYLQAKREQRNFVCVGDRVLCRPSEDEELANPSEDLPQCTIEHLAPRRSKVARQDPSTKDLEHVLASNVDQLLIVASFLNPRIKWGLIDRYLVIAEEQEIHPIIVLNKQDLLATETEKFHAHCEERIQDLKRIGYEVRCVQADAADPFANEDMRCLRDDLTGKITLLSGHSGVGKSSLINLFKPEIVQPVEEDSNIFYKGRHTTTYASFIRLGIGGYVIDSPGIRSFAVQVDRRSLAAGFREIAAAAPHCRYRECAHHEEPECAVKEAVAKGEISDYRYKSYLGLMLGSTGREGRLRDQRQGQDDFAWADED